MPVWLIIILVVAVIGGLIGYATSNDGERGEGAATGCFGGAMGCGYIIFQIFLAGLGIAFAIWLFGLLFG